MRNDVDQFLPDFEKKRMFERNKHMGTSDNTEDKIWATRRAKYHQQRNVDEKYCVEFGK